MRDLIKFGTQFELDLIAQKRWYSTFINLDLRRSVSKGGSRPTFFLSWVAKLFKKSSLGANTNATYQPKSVKKCAKKLFFPQKNAKYGHAKYEHMLCWISEVRQNSSFRNRWSKNRSTKCFINNSESPVKKLGGKPSLGCIFLNLSLPIFLKLLLQLDFKITYFLFHYACPFCEVRIQWFMNSESEPLYLSSGGAPLNENIRLIQGRIWDFLEGEGRSFKELLFRLTKLIFCALPNNYADPFLTKFFAPQIFLARALPSKLLYFGATGALRKKFIQ